MPIPKYSSPVVNRFMKPLSRGYFELASAYATGRTADVQSATFRYRDSFVTDNNLGLVKQVRYCYAAIKCSVHFITSTFFIARWPLH